MNVGTNEPKKQARTNEEEQDEEDEDRRQPENRVVCYEDNYQITYLPIYQTHELPIKLPNYLINSLTNARVTSCLLTLLTLTATWTRYIKAHCLHTAQH